MILDDTPVVCCRIHGEARGQTAVHADDGRILSGPAVFLPYCCSCAVGIRSIPHQVVILMWFSEIGCIEIQETSWLDNDRAAGRLCRTGTDGRTLTAEPGRAAFIAQQCGHVARRSYSGSLGRGLSWNRAVFGGDLFSDSASRLDESGALSLFSE